MTFSLYLLLFPYFAFLFVWTVFSLAAVFHMARFGFKGLTSVATTFVYIGISVFLLMVSYGYISQVDWRQEVTVWQSALNFSSSMFMY